MIKSFPHLISQKTLYLLHITQNQIRMRNVYSVLVLLAILFSSCSQMPNRDLTGNVKDIPDSQKNNEIVIYSSKFHKSQAGDELLSSIKFQVLAYDYYEVIDDDAPGNELSSYSCINMEGLASEYYHQASFYFISDSIQSPPKLSIEADTIQVLTAYFPNDKLEHILEILDSEKPIYCNYKKWSKSGSWASLSYYHKIAISSIIDLDEYKMFGELN